MNFTNLSKNWLVVAGVIILVLAIPLTMYLVRQQQILKSRAAGENILVSAAPPATNPIVGQEFDVDISLNPDVNTVNALEFSLSYPKDIVDRVSFTKNPAGGNFDRVSVSNFNEAAGTFHYLGENTNGSLQRVNQSIGKLRFRGKAAGSGQITFSGVKLTDSAQPATILLNASTSPATITIGTVVSPSPSPSPTLAPGQPSRPDIQFGTVGTPLPSCFGANLTTDQMNQVTLSWRGQATGSSFWVDISTDPGFPTDNFYHKEVPAAAGVTAHTTTLTGFNHLRTGSELVLTPGREYNVRVFNGRVDQDGRPIQGQGIHSNVLTFSVPICPTPTPSPSPSPTPVAAACSNAVPEGLTDTGDRGSAGEKIFSTITIPSNPGLQVTRLPENATILQPDSVKLSGTGDNIIFSPQTGRGGNWVINIPANSRNSTYKIQTRVASDPSGSNASSCPTFIIRVSELTSCTYRSTRVFVKGPGDDFWVQSRPIVINQQVRVAAFHNDGQDTDNFPNPPDVRIFVTEPGGARHAINDVSNGRTDDDNDIRFTPNRPGTWTFSADTKGMQPTPGCVDNTATVVVSSLPATTTKVRIAESPAGLGTSGLFREEAYTETPLTVRDYNFRDKTLGDKHEIWVKFIGTGASGEPTDSGPIGPFPITIVSPDPIVNTVSCDLGVDNTVRFTVKGSNFGVEQKRNGSLKTGQTALKIDSWNNTEVQATLEQTGTVGQSFPVILTRDDGIATDGRDTCLVATTALQLGANFFCRQNLTQTLSNVDVTIAEGRDGGSVAQETVSIGANGLISPLKTKLQQCKPYKIGIKAPGGLRRVVEFVANKGTTKLGSLELPFGDIFPAKGDGKINSADFGQMIREWVVSQAATGEKRADLNGDGRVNSFDWACMRPFFNNSDDSEPEAGLLSITAPSSCPGLTTNTASPTPSSSPTPSGGPTPTGTSVTPTPSGTSPSPSPTPTPTP